MKSGAGFAEFAESHFGLNCWGSCLNQNLEQNFQNFQNHILCWIVGGLVWIRIFRSAKLIYRIFGIAFCVELYIGCVFCSCYPDGYRECSLWVLCAGWDLQRNWGQGQAIWNKFSIKSNPMLVNLPPCCVAQNGHPVWGAFQGTQNPAPDHGFY